VAKPLVIFLNGTSSSGKSTIAQILQQRYDTPLLHTGIDTLYSMMPAAAVGCSPYASFGYRYIMENGFLQSIEVGEYGKRLLACTVPVTQVLIDNRNDVVIDEILFAGEGRILLHSYADIFENARAYFVRVDCPLPVLEAREIARNDRHRGLARLQFNQVHNHPYSYDLTVNTGTHSAEECAESILQFVHAEQSPTAFAAIRAHKKA